MSLSDSDILVCYLILALWLHVRVCDENALARAISTWGAAIQFHSLD